MTDRFPAQPNLRSSRNWPKKAARSTGGQEPQAAISATLENSQVGPFHAEGVSTLLERLDERPNFDESEAILSILKTPLVTEHHQRLVSMITDQAHQGATGGNRLLEAAREPEWRDGNRLFRLVASAPDLTPDDEKAIEQRLNTEGVDPYLAISSLLSDPSGAIEARVGELDQAEKDLLGENLPTELNGLATALTESGDPYLYPEGLGSPVLDEARLNEGLNHLGLGPLEQIVTEGAGNQTLALRVASHPDLRSDQVEPLEALADQPSGGPDQAAAIDAILSQPERQAPEVEDPEVVFPNQKKEASVPPATPVVDSAGQCTAPYNREEGIPSFLAPRILLTRTLAQRTNAILIPKLPKIWDPAGATEIREQILGAMGSNPNLTEPARQLISRIETEHCRYRKNAMVHLPHRVGRMDVRTMTGEGFAMAMRLAAYPDLKPEQAEQIEALLDRGGVDQTVAPDQILTPTQPTTWAETRAFIEQLATQNPRLSEPAQGLLQTVLEEPDSGPMRAQNFGLAVRVATHPDLDESQAAHLKAALEFHTQEAAVVNESQAAMRLELERASARYKDEQAWPSAEGLIKRVSQNPEFGPNNLIVGRALLENMRPGDSFESTAALEALVAAPEIDDTRRDLLLEVVDEARRETTFNNNPLFEAILHGDLEEPFSLEGTPRLDHGHLALLPGRRL